MTAAKSIEPKPLVIPRRLALFLGKSAAIFLQQLHYWLGKSKHLIEGVRWIYNSYQAWADQILMLSSSTIKRAVVRLKELQLIQVEQHSKSDCNHVNWYTIDYSRLEALQAAIGSNCTDRSGQIEQIELFKMTSSSISLDLPERSSESATDSEPAVAAVEKVEEQPSEPEQPPAPSPADAIPQGNAPALSPEVEGRIESSDAPPDFSADLRELGLDRNIPVQVEMQKHPIDRIRDAIAWMRQELPNDWIKKPPAIFTTALREGYKPDAPKPVTPSEPKARVETEYERQLRELLEGGAP